LGDTPFDDTRMADRAKRRDAFALYRKCLVSFSRYSELFVESRKFFITHVHLASHWDYPHWNFTIIFAFRKRKFMGYNALLFA